MSQPSRLLQHGSNPSQTFAPPCRYFLTHLHIWHLVRPCPRLSYAIHCCFKGKSIFRRLRRYCCVWQAALPSESRCARHHEAPDSSRTFLFFLFYSYLLCFLGIEITQHSRGLELSVIAYIDSRRESRKFGHVSTNQLSLITLDSPAAHAPASLAAEANFLVLMMRRVQGLVGGLDRCGHLIIKSRNYSHHLQSQK